MSLFRQGKTAEAAELFKATESRMKPLPRDERNPLAGNATVDDLILWIAWSSDKGSPWLWAAGMLGALLTATYTYRLIFLVFFGEAKTHVGHGPGLRMTLPLVVLSFLSVVAGFINLPPGLGSMPIFSRFLETAVPAAAESHHGPDWARGAH